MTPAQRERASLVETMRSIGPDAPTLCEGWTTRDLAAHLVVRERRLDATPGIMIPFLAGYTDKVQRQVAASTDWDELLNKIASGPPTLSAVQDPRSGREHGRDVHPPRGRPTSSRWLGATRARRSHRHGVATATRHHGPADHGRRYRPG